jgi:hypothetical protein
LIYGFKDFVHHREERESAFLSTKSCLLGTIVDLGGNHELRSPMYGSTMCSILKEVAIEKERKELRSYKLESTCGELEGTVMPWPHVNVPLLSLVQSFVIHSCCIVVSLEHLHAWAGLGTLNTADGGVAMVALAPGSPIPPAVHVEQTRQRREKKT